MVSGFQDCQEVLAAGVLQKLFNNNKVIIIALPNSVHFRWKHVLLHKCFFSCSAIAGKERKNNIGILNSCLFRNNSFI